MKYLSLLVGLFLSITVMGQYTASTKLAILKYRGGDWYSNPTSLNNLADFCNENMGTSIDHDYAVVEAGSPEIFNYPFIHMTGHGNVILNDREAENLRKYCESGGFLHMDDSYGMDAFARLAIAKIFPNKELVEIPFNHPIYSMKYTFKHGPPKIHEHDGKPSQGFGIIYKGRIVLYYTYETDLGDGWEDPEVHHDPPEIRLKALKMGANLIKYAFMN